MTILSITGTNKTLRKAGAKSDTTRGCEVHLHGSHGPSNNEI